MKKISFVIPVYNEEFFIRGLLESIEKVNYPKEDFEVNVVCDGCTDGTVDVVKEFPPFHLIELKQNVGRYAARKIGAEAAVYPNILFVDARCLVDENILTAIHNSTNRFIIGRVKSEKKPGPFETFYVAMRRKIFSSYYASSPQKMELNPKNFDSLPKGTTVMYVEKEVLFRAYDELSDVEMGKDSSDDTKLIRAIVEHTPACLDPNVKIVNFYRKSFMSGLAHLAIYVATSFTDYYLSPRQKFFWLVIVIPLLALFGIFMGLILIPIAFPIKLATLFAVDVAITLFLAKTFREFFIILYMMPLCVLAFYFGVIRAIFDKSANKIRSIKK